MSTKASSPPTLHACLLSLADPPWLPYRIMTSLSAFIYVLLLPSRPCMAVPVAADEEKRRNNGHTNKPFRPPGFRSVRRLSAPVNLAAVSGSCC